MFNVFIIIIAPLLTFACKTDISKPSDKRNKHLIQKPLVTELLSSDIKADKTTYGPQEVIRLSGTLPSKATHLEYFICSEE